MCIMPVGEGAIRVRTGRSGMELGEAGTAGEAAPLSTRIPRLPSARQALDWLTDQAGAQAERWTLWTPVALGLGCGLYFALLREPQAWTAWLLAGVTAAMLIGAVRWSGDR